MTELIDRFKKTKLLISPLGAFFLGTALTCCAYALLSSILGIRLSQHGVSPSQVGIILAFYYVGSVTASVSAHRIINRVGHVRSFAACVSTFAALSLLHYYSQNPIFWGALRLMQGYCIGSATMCLESWLNSRATNKNRGTVMSLYMVTTYLGASLGQAMLNIPDAQGINIYVIVSILFSLALVPISLTALPTPDITAREYMPLKKLYEKTPVGVVGCLVSGFMVGSFYALGPVFSKQIGLSMSETSTFMSFAILGGMAAQIPMGRLSDRTDRRNILWICCSALIFMAPMFMYFLSFGHMYIGIGAASIGFFMFVLYPICVSHVNDLVTDSERVHASGKLILLQGLGLISGPIIVGFIMGYFGAFSYLLCFSFICLAFVLFTLQQMRKRPEINYIGITQTTPVPVDVTPVFDELATKDSILDTLKKSRKRKEPLG